MRLVRIRQLERLIRALLADGYEVDVKVRSSHNLLLITVKLKEGDEADLVKAWDEFRRME